MEMTRPSRPADCSSFRRSGSLLLSMVLLVSLVSACKKRTTVTPPTPSTGSPAPPVGVGSPPALEAFLSGDPGTGESLSLVWKSDHADSVVIDNGIGEVLLQGRMQLPPAARNTYTVTAHGPGGSTSVEVRVDRAVDTRPDLSVPGPGAPSLEEEFSLQLKTIYFELDGARLSEEARLTLDRGIAWLNRPENRSIRFTIQGHSDPVGSEEFGHALGDLRASLVRLYMIERGIDEGRILAASLGEEESAAGRGERSPGKNGRAAFVLDR